MKVISLAYNSDGTVIISVDINDYSVPVGKAIKYRHLCGAVLESAPSYLHVRIIPKIPSKYVELFN